MTTRRWVRSVAARAAPPRRAVPAEVWAALFAYGAQYAQVDTRTADDLLTEDPDTDHARKVSEGCGGCSLLGQLMYAWLKDEPVGDPETWYVYATTPQHVTAWVRHWNVTAPPELVTELEHAIREGWVLS